MTGGQRSKVVEAHADLILVGEPSVEAYTACPCPPAPNDQGRHGYLGEGPAEEGALARAATRSGPVDQ